MKPAVSIRWLVLFVVCTFGGLISASTAYTEHLLDQEPVPLRYVLVNELSGAYSVFVLLPALLRFFELCPVNKGNWYRTIPLHLLVSVVFGIVHTMLMTVSRFVLYPATGMGSYEIGDPVYRFTMEYHKQFLLYLVIFCSHAFLRFYQRSAQLESRLAHAQLESLKGQLQPHFLFNTLNMISSLMYEDVKKADRMISKLSGLLRMSLDSSGRQKIPLEKELEFLNLYLDLMKARFEEKLDVSFSVPEELLDQPVPNFVLQPFVENAIKHNQDSDRIQIQVKASKANGALVLEVRDNGTGIDAPADVFAKGVGLSNARDRLEQIYGADYQLNLTNLPDGGLVVRIALPLLTKEGVRGRLC